MEGKGNFFILLVIVAILTLTLAVLAGYLFLVAGSPQSKTEVTVMKEQQRPSEEELEKVALFEEKKFFNLKTDDDQKVPVIMVNAELLYFKKINGVKDTKAKVDFHLAKIKEIIVTYFQKLSLEEARLPEAKEHANTELTKQINEFLSSNEKKKHDDIVYEIVFEEWFCQ